MNVKYLPRLCKGFYFLPSFLLSIFSSIPFGDWLPSHAFRRMWSASHSDFDAWLAVRTLPFFSVLYLALSPLNMMVSVHMILMTMLVLRNGSRSASEEYLGETRSGEPHPKRTITTYHPTLKSRDLYPFQTSNRKIIFL